MFTKSIRGWELENGVGIRHIYLITDSPVYSCQYNYIKNIK